MATTAATTPSKTSFVKDFLNANPEGTTKSVNEAWLAAGFDGTISPTLVNKTRVAMSGTRLGKARTAAREKTAAKNPRTAIVSPGKTMFVKEFLNDHPEGNVDDVNEGWTAAGFEGTISRTLVDKTRALLGLTGNLRGKSMAKATTPGKQRGRPRKDTAIGGTVTPIGQPGGRASARTVTLNELEVDIDRLIFKVMGMGDLAQIEDSLRHARRLLYGAMVRD